MSCQMQYRKRSGDLTFFPAYGVVPGVCSVASIRQVAKIARDVIMQQNATNFVRTRLRIFTTETPQTLSDKWRKRDFNTESNLLQEHFPLCHICILDIFISPLRRLHLKLSPLNHRKRWTQSLELSGCDGEFASITGSPCLVIQFDSCCESFFKRPA